MKIVYTYWGPGEMVAVRPEIIKLAAISNFFAKKQGFETELHIESRFYKNFYKINYDNIEILRKEEIKHIPYTVWSGAKFVAASKQKTPFLHIDLDFFIYNRGYELLPEIRSKKFLFYHYEHANLKIIRNTIEYFSEKTRNSFDLDLNLLRFNPKNFSMFGTYFPSQPPFLSNAAKEMLEHFKKNKEFYESSGLHSYLQSIGANLSSIIPVTLEQVIYPSLATRHLKNDEIGSFCDITKNKFELNNKEGIYTYHIQAEKEKFYSSIDKVINQYRIKY